MSTQEKSPPVNKEALKELRQARKAAIAEASKRMKAQKKALKAIREQMGDEEGRTIPEIAQAVSMSPAEVLYCVATMKKYGEVLEGDKDGAYFRYRLAQGGPKAEEAEETGEAAEAAAG